MKKPNVLLIHSDQHRFDCVGVNGHKLLKTPHLDKLAAEGMNFTNAFTPVPLCTPARASLLTGQWPTKHFSIANFNTEAPRTFDEENVTFSQLLNDDVYYLGYVGKWQCDAFLTEKVRHNRQVA